MLQHHINTASSFLELRAACIRRIGVPRLIVSTSTSNTYLSTYLAPLSHTTRSLPLLEHTAEHLIMARMCVCVCIRASVWRCDIPSFSETAVTSIR